VYIPCSAPSEHDREACSACGRIICAICNRGNRCGNGCGPSGEGTSTSGGSEDWMRQLLEEMARRQFPVFLYEQGEQRLHDSLRLPDPAVRYYAFLREVEPEDSRGVRNLHVVMECIDADWFDAFEDDLSDFPAWSGCAADASFRIVDFTAEEGYLRDIVTQVDAGKPYFLIGNWLEVRMTADPPEDGQLVAADVYLPANGETNPALVGLSGRETVAFVTAIRRVRPTLSGQRKLRRLEALIAGVEPEEI
jgi:hypothetical protein